MTEIVERSVIKTIKYSNKLLYPLRYEELYSFMIYEKGIKAVYQNIFDFILNELVSRGIIINHNGYFFSSELKSSLKIDSTDEETKLYDYLINERNVFDKEHSETVKDLSLYIKNIVKLKFIKLISFIDSPYPYDKSSVKIVVVTDVNKVYITNYLLNQLSIINSGKVEIELICDLNSMKISRSSFDNAFKYCFLKPLTGKEDYNNTLSNFIAINYPLFDIFINFPFSRLPVKFNLTPKHMPTTKGNIFLNQTDNYLFKKILKSKSNKYTIEKSRLIKLS